MNKKLKKILPLLLASALTLSACSAPTSNTASESKEATTTKNTENPASEPAPTYTYQDYANMTAQEIVSHLTLEQKAAQMLQPAVYCVSTDQMEDHCYGSILSKYESLTYSKWRDLVNEFQEGALNSPASIPYLYGQDDVHGVNYCADAVYFPQNIGLGAANDPSLMYDIGLATADEARNCYMLWNFAPCVAQSVDPRWGRTYESYGADLDMITSLSTQYVKGLLDGGMVACAKHFFADGNVAYGTGECSDSDRIIDRGDSVLTDEEISELLEVYQALVDTGVQTIMISHSSLNGVKMHENADYIRYLKNDMGFEGFIVSDWNSVQNTSGETYYDQVVTAVNVGIDMLMEVDRYDEAMNIIIKAVENADLSEERIDDAVRRIIQVKLDQGIFEDPMNENLEFVHEGTGCEEYRELAKRAVEESLVLLKNENDILPLRAGTKVYVTGPAADNARVQCGGWTTDWLGAPTDKVSGVTTILDGFKEVADEYGIEIITNSREASEADVVVLCVGEDTYAEWYGDSADMELCGDLGLNANAASMDEAEELGIPIVTCIVAGRHVILGDHYDNWDSVVMCYLPGSEGDGIAEVLCGGADFTGTLPSPWYSSVDQIGTGKCWLAPGYGLK